MTVQQAVAHTSPGLNADSTVSDPIVEDLLIMQKASHYRDWIFQLIRPYIGNRIIEVGAGLGSYTTLLADREAVVPMDSHFPCFLHLAQRFRLCPSVIPVYGDIAEQPLLRVLRFQADTVLAINVLEHIPNDVTALTNMRCYLNRCYLEQGRGGRLIVMVPAYGFLYGATDKVVGHVRRYGMADLVDKLDKAGFRTIHRRRVNALAVPAWFINGRILKRTSQSHRQVTAYERMVPWLRRIEAMIPPPFGLSIVVVAEPK